MKKALLCFICIFFSRCTFSQITYLADTAFTTDIGFGGAPASCMAPHTEYFGWHMNKPSGVWLADAFIVPPDSVWVFDTAIVYGYQQGSGVASTFQHGYLQIHDNSGTAIWGDTTTDVMVGTGFTGIYRVDTVTADGGLTSVQRPIMYLKLHLSPAPSLTAGTYWLVWTASGSGSAEPASPDKVLPGRINPTSQQARQYYSGSWHNITDSGNTIGLNKIIKASAGLASVPQITNNSFVLLSQNTPNPFSGSTKITFHLPQPDYAKLAVYNAVGQLVANLVDGNTNAGDHDVTFDASNLAPGIYYYKLSTTEAVSCKQMMVIR